MTQRSRTWTFLFELLFLCSGIYCNTNNNELERVRWNDLDDSESVIPLSCDSLLEVLTSIVKVGSRVEMLLFVPVDLKPCIQKLINKFATPTTALPCSPDAWREGDAGLVSQYLHGSYPMYLVFACHLRDTMEHIRSTFLDKILLYRWIVFYPTAIGFQELLRNFSKLNFRTDSILLLVNMQNVTDVREFYTLNQEAFTVSRSASQWSKPGEDSRCDFQGITLNVIGVMNEYYEFDTKIEITPEGPIFKDSYSYRLLKNLQMTMNFSVAKKVEYEWGYFDEEAETWVGMISALVNGEADLAISSTSGIPSRWEAIDFNFPTTSLGLSAFFKKPQAIFDFDALIEPFTADMWLAILCSVVALTTTLMLFKKVLIYLKGTDSYFLGNEITSVRHGLHQLDRKGMLRKIENFSIRPEDQDPHTLWNPMECFQGVMSSFCFQQGIYRIPTYGCYRIVISLGFLAGVVLYGAYTGTLVSFVSSTGDRITCLEQLVSNSHAVSIVSSPIASHFFQFSKSPFYRDIFKIRRQSPAYLGLDDAKDEILRGEAVVILSYVKGYFALDTKFSTKECCQIQEIRIPHSSHKQGTMVPKGSEYRRVFDYQFLRMREFGILHQLNQKFIPKRIRCDDGATFAGVELSSVSIAFAILALGAALSLHILCIEKLIKGCVLRGF